MSKTKISKAHIAFGLIVGLLATLALFGTIDPPRYIDTIFVSTFLFFWLFTAGIHAKQMSEKAQLNDFMVYVYSPLVTVIVLIDVFFNITWGSIAYREIPREFLFTTRTKRHMKSNGHQLSAARRWAKRLNAVDPGHV